MGVDIVRMPPAWRTSVERLVRVPAIRTWPLRIVRSGWIPAILLAWLAVRLLSTYEVPTADIRSYGIWLLYGIALPGTLIWRACRGTPRTLLEDVAAGSVVGFAAEILVYIVLRAVDAPELIRWWPALVVVHFVAIPPLRRHLKPALTPRVPTGWAWAMAACVALVMFWFAFWSFRAHPMTGPVAGIPYVDIPYHLSLAGEVKHHMPPTWPYVLGEPLHHHWFAHAELAASSWASGVELRSLMMRLQLFPFMALTVVLTGLLAVRVTRRWWPGIVAVLGAFFVSALSPYVWDVRSPFADIRALDHYMWQSPSSLVGAAIFAPIPLLIVDRFRKERGQVGGWLLIGLLVAVSMGTKSTLVPLLLAGLGLAGLSDLIFKRRINTTALFGGELCAIAFAFSYFVLYGGNTYGMEQDAFATFRRLPLIEPLQLGFHNKWDEIPFPVVRSVAILALVAWLARGIGAIGLLSRRDRPREPWAPFLAGMVLFGVVIAFVYTHPGQSQIYFLRSASPFIGVLGAAGLAMLVPRERRQGPVLAALAGAGVLGALGAVLAAQGQTRIPIVEQTGSLDETIRILARPMIVVGAMVLALGVGLAVLSRPVRWLRGVVLALTLAAATGTALPVTVGEFQRMYSSVSAEGARRDIMYGTAARPIPPEALPAARWLRDHSSPADVVATNQHCRYASKIGCENRHFWISAYTERRVLVEGWGYTTRPMNAGKNYSYFPYWNPERLAENDRAFFYPSRATIGLLRSKYGVRWLFVDERYERPSKDLPRFATLRHRRGSIAIYEI